MDEILRELYLQRAETLQLSKEYWALYRESGRLWENIGPLLDYEQIMQLQLSESAVCAQSNLEWFREGWRMGMLLTMNLLGQLPQ